MSALVIGLLILAVICFGYLAVEAHKKDMAALNAKWQAKYDTDHGRWVDLYETTFDALLEESSDHNDTRVRLNTSVGRLEWAALQNTVLQAELDRHFLMPTIDGLRAAYRDLAPVVPIGGRG